MAGIAVGLQLVGAVSARAQTLLLSLSQTGSIWRVGWGFEDGRPRFLKKPAAQAQFEEAPCWWACLAFSQRQRFPAATPRPRSKARNGVLLKMGCYRAHQRRTSARQGRRQPVSSGPTPAGRPQPTGRPSIRSGWRRRPGGSAGSRLWAAEGNFLVEPSRPRAAQVVGTKRVAGAGSTPAPRPASGRGGALVVLDSRSGGVLAIRRRAATYRRSQFKTGPACLLPPAG